MKGGLAKNTGFARTPSFASGIIVRRGEPILPVDWHLLLSPMSRDGRAHRFLMQQLCQHPVDLYAFAVICLILTRNLLQISTCPKLQAEVTSAYSLPHMFKLETSRRIDLHLFTFSKGWRWKKKQILLFSSQVDNQVLRVLVRRRKEQDGLSTMYAVKTLL